MTEVSDRYERVATGFEGRLINVSDGQWMATTPCSDWTVRDLVSHVVGTQNHVFATLGVPAVEVHPDGDLADQFGDARRRIEGALADPDRAGQTVGGMFGEQPFESLVSRLLCADTLFHTWDLARATGQDEELDPEAVSKATEFLTPMDEAIRRPGGFAPRIEPAPNADLQTRLLNFGGRAV
jgi:uncharacterized protein (TIGR03086 family)